MEKLYQTKSVSAPSINKMYYKLIIFYFFYIPPYFSLFFNFPRILTNKWNSNDVFELNGFTN